MKISLQGYFYSEKGRPTLFRNVSRRPPTLYYFWLVSTQYPCIYAKGLRMNNTQIYCYSRLCVV